MRRIICVATILNEDKLQDVIHHLSKYHLDYEMITPFRIKVDYNGYEKQVFEYLDDLFDSLESHSIHYYY